MFISELRFYDKFGDFRRHKGNVLKASVEYINLLKAEFGKSRIKDAKIQQLEHVGKAHLLRIQVSTCFCSVPTSYFLPELRISIKSTTGAIIKENDMINFPNYDRSWKEYAGITGFRSLRRI